MIVLRKFSKNNSVNTVYMQYSIYQFVVCYCIHLCIRYEMKME